MPSQKGCINVFRHGYRYNFRDISRKGCKVWRCVRKDVCKAKIVTSEENKIIKEDTHNCIPDEIENLNLKIKCKCIEKVTNEATPISQIYQDVLEELQIAEKGLGDKIIPLKSLTSTLHRHRQKAKKQIWIVAS
ncbi:hypothetical protein JYU34_004338 [Plutella xylostella]|uniref:FLYWCH-type domain-containing protein n=1 Tax=Plutella xylostella TaxID=51655 RepID=A0ABQ7QXQ7_PLUXY|nr:hypothetical protein JYU34_004338 [Plutella xylostella]